MNRNRELESRLNGVSERAQDRVRYYAGETANTASNLIERGRQAGRRWSRGGLGYGKQLSHAAEDLADEANYQYRRARRHVSRHPVAAVAIVAGTIGAFLLLRRLFRDED
jgi:hypothetical protein